MNMKMYNFDVLCMKYVRDKYAESHHTHSLQYVHVLATGFADRAVKKFEIIMRMEELKMLSATDVRMKVEKNTVRTVSNFSSFSQPELHIGQVG